jgi:hypothetical protein
MAESEKIDLSKFAKTITKRSSRQSRPKNYQSYQAAVKLPAFRDGKPMAAQNMRDFDIGERAE